MHHASPVRWWCSRLMRYITGSRRFWLGDAHVDLRAQHVRAVGELAGAHAREEVEVLGDGPVAVRAHARPPCRSCRAPRGSPRASGCRRTPCPARRASRRARRASRSSPTRSTGGRSQSKPSQRTSSWIERTYSSSSTLGLVSSKRRLHTAPGDGLRDAEVQADGLGVTDVQVAVRLGRKARHHLAAVLAGGDVGLHELEHEVRELLGGRRRGHGRGARAWRLARWVMARGLRCSNPRLGILVCGEP